MIKKFSQGQQNKSYNVRLQTKLFWNRKGFNFADSTLYKST